MTVDYHASAIVGQRAVTLDASPLSANSASRRRHVRKTDLGRSKFSSARNNARGLKNINHEKYSNLLIPIC